MSISEGQHKLKLLLKKAFPHYNFEEEYYIKTTGQKFDFFCRKLKIAIEFDSKYHYDNEHFFFHTEEDLKIFKKNEKRKQRWCKLNDITLIIIKEDELNIKAIKRKIQNEYNRRQEE